MSITRYLSLFARNIRNAARGRKHRFSYDAVAELFLCRDGGNIHYFANRERGFSLYRKGLKSRGSRLASSYCIDTLAFTKTDVVIDCGANYGDLWLFLKTKINPRNYLTVEPGDEEHRSCRSNAPNGKHINLALGDQNGRQTFFVHHADADSSLIEPPEYEDRVFCDVITLDSLCEQNGIQRVKLLKLEAEGFEPEILIGGTQMLNQTEYVAVDGGYERGVNSEETMSAVSNILYEIGFCLIKVNWCTHRALFRNQLSEGPNQ